MYKNNIFLLLMLNSPLFKLIRNEYFLKHTHYRLLDNKNEKLK